MKRFIELLINNRRAGFLILALLLVAGIIFIGQTPVSFYPRTQKPAFFVQVSATGVAAEDMYNDYNAKIQSAILAIADLESSSVTYFTGRGGFIAINLEFPWRMSIAEAELATQSFVSQLTSILPNSFNKPLFGARSDGGASGELSIALYSSMLTNEEIYMEALTLFEDDINNLSEVDILDISPIQQLKAEVTFHPDTLLSYGFTVDSILNRVSSEYRTVSMGNFQDGRKSFTVRSLSSISNIFDLEKIPVGTVGKQTILLGNVAEVKVFYDLPRNVYRVDGEPAIVINVTPKQGESVKVMAEKVLAIINEKMPLFSQTVEADVLLNPAQFIDVAINNVLNSAIIGAILAMIVTLLFLGVFRNTFIVVSAIPISIIYAFIFLYNFDISINLISLSGLALAVGMSLDAAIVVMENIHRHRLENARLPNPLPIKEVITKATAEVAQPVFMSALTTIAVFLPLRYTSPLAAAILGDLALAIIFTLITSVFVSFTVLPLLAYYFFRPSKNAKNIPQEREPQPDSWMLRLSHAVMGFLLKLYKGGLSFFLGSKLRGIILLSSSVVLFALSLLIVTTGQIPFLIMEEPNSANLNIKLTHSDVDNINDFILEVEPIEDQIMDLIGKHLSTRLLKTSGTNQGTLSLGFTSAKHAEEALEILQSHLISDNTWTFVVSQYNPAAMPLPDTFAVQVAVSGASQEKIFHYLEQIVDLTLRVQNAEGTRAYTSIFSIPSTTPTSELIFRARDEVFIDLPEYTKARLTSLITTYLNGSRPVTFLLDDGQEMRPLFRFPALSSKEDVGNILIPYNNMALPVSHFFTIEEDQGLSMISITDQITLTEIRGRTPKNTLPADLVRYERELEDLIKEHITFDAGYSYRMLDARAITNDAIRSLAVALVISVLLVFLVLTIQFNSFKLSLIILLAIPLGIIGAIFSLDATNLSISINSMLGMILLGGIAINNSLLIVDFYIHDTQSRSKKEAIIHACMLRFPAILSTTVTTLLAMLPLAIAIGDGANVIQSLGVAVSGGLLLSTFFTLFVIPVTLFLFSKERNVQNY